MTISKTGKNTFECFDLESLTRHRKPQPLFSILDYIQTVPLFSDLSSEQLIMIHSGCKEKAFPKGSVIFLQDEPGQDLYIILSGKIKVSLLNEEGREIVLAVLEKGQFFGELSLLDKKNRSAMITAGNDTTLLILSRKTFLEILEKQPVIIKSILSVLADRLRKADERIESLAFMDVCGRLSSMILEMAKDKGKRGVDGFISFRRPTHNEIAGFIGASREAVTKALKSLADSGLIKVEGKEIIISLKQLEIA